MRRFLTTLAGAAVCAALATPAAQAQIFRIPRPNVPSFSPPVVRPEAPKGFILTDPDQKPGNFNNRPGNGTSIGAGQVGIETNPTTTTTIPSNTGPTVVD